MPRELGDNRHSELSGHRTHPIITDGSAHRGIDVSMSSAERTAPIRAPHIVDRAPIVETTDRHLVSLPDAVTTPESTTTSDIRESFRGHVPDALIDGLNQRGVFTEYVAAVDTMAEGAATEKIVGLDFVDTARNLLRYDDYVFSKIGTHLAEQGVPEAAQDDEIDAVADYLLGEGVPVSELQAAVQPVLDVVREGDGNPIAVIDVIKGAGLEDKMRELFGPKEAPEANDTIPHDDPGNGVPSPRVRTVLHEEAPESDKKAERLAALEQRVQQFHMTRHIVDAQEDVLPDPDEYEAAWVDASRIAERVLTPAASGESGEDVIDLFKPAVEPQRRQGFNTMDLQSHPNRPGNGDLFESQDKNT